MNIQEASALLNVRIPVMGTELEYAYSRLQQEVETRQSNNLLTAEQAQARLRQLEQAYQVLQASIRTSPVYGVESGQTNADPPLQLPEIQLPQLPNWDEPTAVQPIELPGEISLPEPVKPAHDPVIQSSSSPLPAEATRQPVSARIPTRTTSEETRRMQTAMQDTGRKQPKHASPLAQRRNEIRHQEDRQSPPQPKNSGSLRQDEDLRNFVRIAYGAAIVLWFLGMLARNAIVFALGLELALIALVAGNSYGIGSTISKLNRSNPRAARQIWIYLIVVSFFLFLILGTFLFSGGR